MSENRSKGSKNRQNVSICIKISADSKHQLQGKIIRILRISLDMTQQEFAGLLGVSRGSIIDIEKKGAVDGVQLFAIAQILGVDVSTFDPN